MKRIGLLCILLTLATVTPLEAEQLLLNSSQLAISLQQGNTEAVLKNDVSNLVDKTSEGWLRNLLSTKQGVTEISFQGITGDNPVWSFLFLRPLTESRDLKNNTFFQGSVFREDGRTTLNAGYGYRRLVNDKKVLVGTNIFYDHEFPYNHQRMSVGCEIRTTVGEINANLYKGLSGWKNVDNNIAEKALGGYDTEIALAFPYIPSAQFRYKHFNWIGVENTPDLKGNTFSITATISNGLSVEAGYTDYLNGYADYNKDSVERFVKVAYSIGIGAKKAASKPRISNSAYAFESMVDKRFDKVRRENRIIKARRSSNFVVLADGNY
jgi:hypothetical protein